MTEPSTATPRAAPISRVVSLTADPTPALAGGSDPMIDSVAGGITMARPAASTTRATRTSGYPAPAVSRLASGRPVAAMTRPVATITFVPTRSTSLADDGATTICT